MSSLQSDPIVQGAMSLHEAGKMDQAVDELICYLETSPDEGRAWELLGLFLFAKQEFDSAQGALEKASAIIALSARGQVALGKCYAKSGYRESAVAIYTHLASLDSVPVDLFEPLASGLGSCDEVELALDVCRKAARAIPDDPAPLVGMAHYMLRLARPIEHVLPIMFRAYHLEPDSAEYSIMLAWLLHEAGCADDAVSIVELLPIGQFKCVRCLSRMELIFHAANKFELAAECRNRINELEEPTQLGNRSA